MGMVNFIAKIPQDKLLHYIVGVLVAAAGIMTFHLSWWLVMCVVAVLALGKEVVDQIRYGGFDWKDLIATIIGGATVIIMNFIGQFLI